MPVSCRSRRWAIKRYECSGVVLYQDPSLHYLWGRNDVLRAYLEQERLIHPACTVLLGLVPTSWCLLNRYRIKILCLIN